MFALRDAFGLVSHSLCKSTLLTNLPRFILIDTKISYWIHSRQFEEPVSLIELSNPLLLPFTLSVPLSIEDFEPDYDTLRRTAKSIGYLNLLKEVQEEKKLTLEKGKKLGNLDLFTKLG